jgi:hypothetical protein
MVAQRDGPPKVKEPRLYSTSEVCRLTGLSKSRISHLVNGRTYKRERPDNPKGPLIREYKPVLKKGKHYYQTKGKRDRIFTEAGLQKILDQKAADAKASVSGGSEAQTQGQTQSKQRKQISKGAK